MNSLFANYKKSNIAMGWLIFAISLITYTLTLEPTLSFWDAGEYLSTATKLEVGHPPGAPLYQMLGAVFSIFAPEKSDIAFAINMLAAVSSAFTILFMYWITTNLLKKVVYTSNETKSTLKNWSILLSASVGCLAFTFSDSFWYSAVEAEVYATAMFLTSLLLWLGLRWVDAQDGERSDKWLLMIGLVVGLSFGVHFMALLTIPSIGYLYYFKKCKKVTLKNFIIASILIISILLFSFLFLMPLTMAFFAKSEVFFVNTIGLPFNSGTILAFIIIISAFITGLFYTRKKNKTNAHSIILTLVCIFIGFSSWIMLPIRANTQAPINENKPSDAAELISYYNREQYGIRSLFYDTFYSLKYNPTLDDKTPYVDGTPNYERNEKTKKYEIVNNYKNSEPNYSSKLKGFLPRMWSTDGNHPMNYMNYVGALKLKAVDENSEEAKQFVAKMNQAVEDEEISYQDYEMYIQDILNNPKFEGEFELENPSFIQNMKFMFEYQFGYMYWRYLMWNFSGRQNDIQGNNDRENGNWVTGINFIDQIRIGNQDNLPSDLSENKGKNHYYMLPFIIGLIGFFFHSKRDQRSFFVLLTLFVFTSFALKVFLNERPFEPRERDYAVVASFMVFAIWIAFGTYAIFNYLSTKLKTKVALPIAITACLLAAPVLMAKENWDDHDRSDKYTALALAKAYLDSLDPNAIIFTIGDNDTFPLWYMQEVEEYRTDVRVVNTALLQSEWYTDQMKVKSYKSAPLPIRFSHEQYVGNNMYYGAVFGSDERYNVNDILDYIGSDDPRTKVEGPNGMSFVKIPTNKIKIPVNKQTVLDNHIVAEKYADKIVPQINLDIQSTALYRQRIMMLDIIASNNWERPIYFSGGSTNDEEYLWLKDYLQLTGLTYKLVPIKSKTNNDPMRLGFIDTEQMFNTVTNWYWGNMGSSEIYHDPETRKNAFSLRINLARLAEQLVVEKKYDKAEIIVDLAMENMPIKYYDSYFTLDGFAAIYYEIGKEDKARKIINELAQNHKEWLDYYASISPREQGQYVYEIINKIQDLTYLAELSKKDTQAKSILNNLNLDYYNNLFKRYLDALEAQRKIQEAEAKKINQQNSETNSVQ